MTPLTDRQHQALERLDAIQVKLARSTFTQDVAKELTDAIDAIEDAIRYPKQTLTEVVK